MKRHIVMEFCEGDLFDLMDDFDGLLLEPDVVRVAKQLAEAIKIYIRFKIADFGFAQHMEDYQRTLHVIGGTPAYAAPEISDPLYRTKIDFLTDDSAMTVPINGLLIKNQERRLSFAEFFRRVKRLKIHDGMIWSHVTTFHKSHSLSSFAKLHPSAVSVHNN